MPTRPTIAVAIALTTDPSATPTWTDVTAYVQAFSIKRGRSYELGAVPAGTLALTLDNLDRRFDPTWTGGPYGSNVKLRRRVRIQATWNSVTYDLMHGYITAFQPAYSPTNGDAVMVIQAADGFKTLGMLNLNTSFVAQNVTTRIGAVLDAAGWLAADRDLSTSLYTTQAVTLDNVGVLSHLQRIVDDEAGRLFVSRSGKVTYRRRHESMGPLPTTHVTMGDGGGAEELYPDVAFSFDDQYIANDVRVTRTGGTEQVASDSASQATYLPRTQAVSGTLHASDGDAYELAHALLYWQKDPRLRTATLTIDPDADAATLWPHVLGRDVGDRIGLKRRPPGGGTIDQPSTIEGVALDYRVEGALWAVAWELSPADTTAYWLVDDSTYSVLNTSTLPGY